MNRNLRPQQRLQLGGLGAIFQGGERYPIEHFRTLEEQESIPEMHGLLKRRPGQPNLPPFRAPVELLRGELERQALVVIRAVLEGPAGQPANAAVQVEKHQDH